ncbi:hypothetical protein [Streptomyces sp. GC420]|uniref:hypothetical protein n=1 Tax=Streptomyces sp. GC420 TaxID=2697568 RepID=UPI00141518B7|nr:hypothetical protein [Streptomyces sp. GC420]NBM20603.1 hypothetical protein [Streptomyces sp. GC420]
MALAASDSAPSVPAASPVAAPPAPSPVPAGPAEAAPAVPEVPAVPVAVKDRRVLRALVRWTAAVLVLGAVGTGTAYGIAALDRTDVPGLATENDGRWDFPRLSLPALPDGSPRPFSDGNEAEVHHADLRELLLPAPAGAAVDKELEGGWSGIDRYVSEYEKDKRADLKQALGDSALRHIAARGWTMPDGTGARIYLLRFKSVAFADAFLDEQLQVGAVPGAALAGAPDSELDEDWDNWGAPGYAQQYVFEEPKPYGAQQVRQAYLAAGDTLALVVHEKKGGAAAVPFHQTVILQNQLLG